MSANFKLKPKMHKATGVLGDDNTPSNTLHAIFAIKYLLLDQARTAALAEAEHAPVPVATSFSAVAKQAEAEARKMVAQLTPEQQEAVVAMFETWTLSIDDLLFAVTKLSK